MKAFLILYRAEMRRYLAETRVYLSSYVSAMIVTAIVVAMFVFSTDFGSDPAYWVGFLFWNAAATLISESCVSISADKQSGTFTQLMLRPTSMLTQITVKTLTWSVVNIIIDVVFLVAFFLLIGAPVGFAWPVIPIALITFAGLFGLTMVMASLTILFTKTASWCDLIGYAMMFLGGVTVPVEQLPMPLAAAGRLLPITPGIAMSRAVLHGESPTVLNWLLLSGQSLAFVLGGYVVFQLIMRHGRRHGIRMRY
ncbi:ABC transporter permease [Bifidobacterium avesanii]|uniref:ABC transporter permease n=1 Tax=Bifidobacterium avesanii TaxID=1798157 RepID=A0A7K3TK48_9BIFI|nr:ABC transporter permease [Bifidobacterium avesanii]KAB8292004.1 ABC transporter [Bifidobacterium avesanii]NEG78633.1 ABC transporter permease [Bifidobacterium avesanii]